MGNQKHLNIRNGFIQYLYEDHPKFPTVTINGIKGKALHFIDDGKKEHTGLPQYAGTPNVYFRVGKDGNIVQGKVYVNRKHCIDFDWSHKHVNADGKSFSKGIVHVQTYSVGEDGTTHRLSDSARLMTEEEIAKYGPLIHAFNPNVKFKP